MLTGSSWLNLIYNSDSDFYSFFIIWPGIFNVLIRSTVQKLLANVIYNYFLKNKSFDTVPLKEWTLV